MRKVKGFLQFQLVSAWEKSCVTECWAELVTAGDRDCASPLTHAEFELAQGGAFRA